MARQPPSGKSVHRAVVQKLESLQRAGVTTLPKIKLAKTTDLESDENPVAQGDPVAKGEPVASREPVATREVVETLEVIARDVAACTLCEELVANRTQTVFGVGNPSARLCFLGEAPGADEDRQGEPFVGRAGKLLTDIVVKGMGLRREDVYILNILKCRPPGNRNPRPEESNDCRGFLDRQLAFIQPEFICCLGAVAAQNLLNVTTPISHMRGNFYEYRGIRVLCTYHPAYLLRNPAAKKDVWGDIQLLMREMGIEPPK